MFRIYSWQDDHPPEEEGTYHAINMVNEHCRKLFSSEAGYSPVIVNCSAGKGRTGTYIASYFICEMLTDWRLQSGEASAKREISIFKIVRRLREQRWGLVAKQVFSLKRFHSACPSRE